MPLNALILVVLAAFTHATWNLLAKKAASAGTAFVFAYGMLAVLMVAPWAIWQLCTTSIVWSWPMLGFIVLSALFHLGYSVCLQYGYQVADLSVVYPIARGSGPLLSTCGAFLLLGERAQVTGIVGMLCVVVGIFLIATQGQMVMFKDSKAWVGVRWGVLIGLLIAAYTVTDGYIVKVLLLAPVVLNWFSHILRSLILMPTMVCKRTEVMRVMRGYWRLAFVVGLLSPLSYILVLQALRMGAPLSLAAPMREMAMMVGTVFGMVLLGEPRNPWRLAGCGVIMGGVGMLGISP